MLPDVILGNQFTFSIIGVGPLWIVQANGAELFLVAHAIAAETAHQQEFLGGTLGGLERMKETACIFRIYLIKLFPVGCFRKTCVVDDEIPWPLLLCEVS